jgi:tetratricopeptide (TPR) repeat protein
MRKFSFLPLVLVLLSLAACKPKPKEVTSVARAEATHLAAEAQLQSSLHDYAEAEKLLAHAVELDPEVISYWSGLGVNRVLLGDKSGAKKAYKRELELCEEAAKKSPKDIQQQLAALRPLVCLNRADDARKLLEKVARENPGDAQLKQLVDSKAIDQMLANPKVQEAIIK